MAAIFDVLVIIGDLLGIGLAFSCILSCLFIRSEIITPEQYQRERVTATSPRPGEFEPDLAWALYPFRQAKSDLTRVGAETARRYQKLWTWPIDAFFRGLYGRLAFWWFFFPVPLSILFILVVAGVAALATYVLFTVVTVICAAAALLLLAAVTSTLRSAENYRRRRMQTDASCPRCYHVTPWPAYQCPGCRDLHRDLRPGRLGILSRRCHCDTHIPTMPLRAAWQLKASCQRCDARLPTGSGAIRDIRIPIFGDLSAGKTRFLYAALYSLIRDADRADIDHTYPDENSKNDAKKALALIRSGDDTPKTSSSSLPSPLSILLGSGKKQTLVHMFDAAGETLRNPEMHDALGFLALGQGLAYVLDPLSIGYIRDRLTRPSGKAFKLPELTNGDPENAFNETVSRLRDSGVRASEQRLAVIVSKVDLLRITGLEDIPEDSVGIAEWLERAGLHNLALAAKRDFADVRYFTVASHANPHELAPYDPGVPLGWLLRAHGVPWPSDPEVVRSSQPLEEDDTHSRGREDDPYNETAETI